MRFLVVIAGLEHTGHHLWTGSDVYARTGRPGIFPQLQGAHQVLLSVAVSNNRSAQEYADTLLRQPIGDTAFGYVAIPSYPGGTYHQALQNRLDFPALPTLRTASKLAGVPLKVIVTTRGAAYSIRTGDWPNKGATPVRMRILVDACKRLERDLSHFEAFEVLCMPYDSYLSRLPLLSTFLDTNTTEAVRKAYKPRSSPLPFVGGPLHACIERLEVKWKCQSTFLKKQ
jgi:hypothetical protein